MVCELNNTLGRVKFFYLVGLPFNEAKKSWDFLVFTISACNFSILMNDFPLHVGRINMEFTILYFKGSQVELQNYDACL